MTADPTPIRDRRLSPCRCAGIRSVRLAGFAQCLSCGGAVTFARGGRS